MIAKITTGNSFAGVINYVLKKDAVKLHVEGVRDKSKSTMIDSFETQAQLNPKVSKPVVHISLNFSNQDKGKITDFFMKKVAREYIESLGYSNTQYMIVRHHDSKHDHLHIVLNRVDNDGKRISDKYEKVRSKNICKELTEKHELYFASGKEAVNEHRLKEPDKTRYEIYNLLKEKIPECKDWNSLTEKLREAGVKTEFRYKEGTKEVQGVKFIKGKYAFSGSKIDKSCRYFQINEQFQSTNRLVSVIGDARMPLERPVQQKSSSVGLDLLELTVEITGAACVDNLEERENKKNKKYRKR